MTVRTCLKSARRLLVGDAPGLFKIRDLFVAVDSAAVDAGEANDALEALQAQACPARAAMEVAVLRWLESGKTADGVRAVDLARRPGATLGLFEWLEAPGRKHGEVLRVLDAAIAKA